LIALYAPADAPLPLYREAEGNVSIFKRSKTLKVENNQYMLHFPRLSQTIDNSNSILENSGF